MVASTFAPVLFDVDAVVRKSAGLRKRLSVELVHTAIATVVFLVFGLETFNRWTTSGDWTWLAAGLLVLQYPLARLQVFIELGRQFEANRILMVRIVEADVVFNSPALRASLVSAARIE